jgi:hypothetical protein
MEKNVLKLSLLIMSLAGLTACGGFDALDSGSLKAQGIPHVGKPFGACDRSAVATINLCIEAVGSDYNEPGYLQILQSSCETTGGTYAVDNCDHTGSLGTCYILAEQPNETHVTYFPPEYTAASAQSACASTAGGVYSPN